MPVIRRQPVAMLALRKALQINLSVTFLVVFLAWRLKFLSLRNLRPLALRGLQLAYSAEFQAICFTKFSLKPS